MRVQRMLFLVAVCLSVTSCDVDTPDAVVSEYLDLPNEPHQYFVSPGSNIGMSNEQIQLGRVLFYDTRLSANNIISCASCHKQSNAFADNVAFSTGFQGGLTLRNTLPLVDARRFANFKSDSALFPRAGGMFWDGRKTGMNEAVLEPILNHIEMGIASPQALEEKLKEVPYYGPLVKSAFGDRMLFQSFQIQSCLEAFISVMRSHSSRFQQSEMGHLKLNDSELLGQKLFVEKYNCAECHKGQLGKLTPNEYQFEAEFANIGLHTTSTDPGLALTTGLSVDKGVFRVPSLNNVGLTAPYMHDGSLATLEDVLDHYSGNIQAHPNLDARLKDEYGAPLRMNISEVEKKAIIDFLLTFTDPDIATDQWLSNPFKAGRN